MRWNQRRVKVSEVVGISRGQAGRVDRDLRDRHIRNFQFSGERGSCSWGELPSGLGLAPRQRDSNLTRYFSRTFVFAAASAAGSAAAEPEGLGA